MSVHVLEARNGDVRLAYEVRGEGEPVVFVHGLALRPARLGAAAGPARAATSTSCSRSTTAASARATCPRALLGAADGRRRGGGARRRGHRSSARLRRLPRRLHRPGVHAPDPSRVRKLVLASTAPGGPRMHPMPAAGLEAFSRFPTMEREAGLRLMVENSLGEHGVRERPELVEEIFAYRLERAPTAGGLAGAGGGGRDVSTPTTACPRSQAPTLVLAGRSRHRRRPAERGAPRAS